MVGRAAFARRGVSATVVAAFLAPCPALAQEGEPWRLAEAVDAPDWLTLEGEARVRYETLDGQFRAGGKGSDQLLALRSLFLAEADAGPVAVGIEIQDSRGYLDDAGAPLSTSIVNPADILQAYLRADLDGIWGTKSASLKLGRQTVDIGSRRVIERVDMANVIFAYTGAYWRSVGATGDELHALYVSPTGRRPNNRDLLGKNDLSGDEEEWGRRFWGVHYMRANLLGAWLPRVTGEVYVYGLDERDTGSVPTPNRDYLQPGFRVVSPPTKGRLDFEIEASARTGTRRASSNAADQRDLKVNASMLYAHVGYTFEHPWEPRVALDYYFSSGDDDPTDGEYNQFERLFGGRRSDLGNTGIHGPLTTANIDALGARIELAPNDRLDLRLAWKAAYLDEPRDAWVQARVQDPQGQSGDFIGNALEFRSRYWLAPGSLRAELGASALFAGAFARNAPNASRQGDTLFGYFQVTQSF